MQNHALIGDVLGVSEDGSWNLQFRRSPFVWEGEGLQRLQQMLQGSQVNTDGHDSIEQQWNSNKQFSVSSAYAEWEKFKLLAEYDT